MFFQFPYFFSLLLMPFGGNHVATRVFSINADRHFVQVGEYLPLQVVHEGAGYVCSWAATSGYFTDYAGGSVNFHAPLSPGKVVVTCKLLRNGKVKSIAQMEITVFSRIIVLKADDLVSDEVHVFPPMWNNYFAFIDSLKIKASAGIIAESLVQAPEAYYTKIKAIAAQGNVEFWNHGYNHNIHVRKQDGSIYHEFQHVDFVQQKEHLARAQELGKQKLGIIFKTFGAPGNFHDENTLKAIEENDEVKIWLYGNSESHKSILPRLVGCNIEYPVHYPDFHRFASDYQYVKEPVVTLQFHPTRWDGRRFSEFRQIVFYLKDTGALFLTPLEYAETFHPALLKESSTLIL